jgi:hypothetical protein
VRGPLSININSKNFLITLVITRNCDGLFTLHNFLAYPSDFQTLFRFGSAKVPTIFCIPNVFYFFYQQLLTRVISPLSSSKGAQMYKHIVFAPNINRFILGRNVD